MFEKIKQYWVAFISLGLLAVSGLFVANDRLGYSVATGYESTVRSSMSTSQTFVRVSSLALKDGETLDMTKLGSRLFLTIEPGKAKEEIVMCTSINTSTVSFENCTRGLAFSGTSTVSVANNQKTHNAGARVVLSNVHYVYEQLTDIDTDQTVGGLWNFEQLPTTVTSAPVSDEQIATKKYVDGVALSAAPDATVSVKGVLEVATAAEAAATAAAGSGDTSAALSLTTSLTNWLGGISGNWIPVSTSSGYIHSSWGGVAGSLATLNSSALVVQNPASASSTTGVGVIPITNASSTLDDSFINLNVRSGFLNVTSTATTTIITHGLGRTPRNISFNSITLISNSSGFFSYATGFLTSSGQNAIGTLWNANGTDVITTSTNNYSILGGYASGGTTYTGLFGSATVNSTTITLTWTNIGGGSINTDFSLMWQAY